MKTIVSMLVSGFILAPAASAQVLHPNLESKAVHLHRVAVLPARVDIQRSGVKGGESMIKESEAASDSVGSVVVKLLRDRGLVVLEDPVRVASSTGSGDAADERRTAIAELQSRLEAILPQLESKPKDVKKGRFSLGDEVAGFVAEGADAIVFVRGTGVVITKGKRFLAGLGDAVAGGYGTVPSTSLFCRLIIVDSHTGDVLFTSADVTGGDIVKSAGKEIEKPLKRSLKKLPVG